MGFRVALAKTQSAYPYTDDLSALKADVASAADLAAERALSKQESKEERYAIEIYTVKAGDSLGKIAYEHGMTIRELKELNGLTDLGTFRVGTILQVKAKQGSTVRRTAETQVPLEWQLRPVWMNFCRYCRHPFTGVYIPKKCPNCGKYVFGD